MWRICALPAFALVAVALVVRWPAAQGTGGEKGAAAEGPKTIGVSGCAAASCHHGNGERGSKGSEYSTWVAVDPHARAYRTLFKPESKAMYEALKKGDPASFGPKGAHDTPLCLQCHGAGAGASPALHQDGTGCESCHGPAEKWKASHYQAGFDRKTPGFYDLRDDLTVRAETCMKCHVGDATREVNHDLIAAGHPRLRFEYAAYYANYPRHWADGEKASRKDMEARSWVVGQLVAAKAALELLADRAGDDKRPWPEFGEYDCAACHHGLSKPSFRQERDAKGLDGRRAGDLPWGTWYYTLLPAVREAAPGGSGLEEKLKGLAEQMRKRLPNRAKVREMAKAAAKEVGEWLAKAKEGKYTAEQVARLMRSLAKRTGPLQQGWDGGTQVYLGLAALHHARCDLDEAFAKSSPAKKPLEKMRKSLRGAFPEKARPLYDSPLKYDPKETLKGLGALREALK